MDLSSVLVVIFCLLLQNSFAVPVVDNTNSNVFSSDLKENLIGRVENLQDFTKYEIEPLSVSEDVIEDAFLTTPELITKYGYPVENHTVQTPDGYILEIHRIPKPNGIPVFLQHGIMDSSGGWVIMGPKKAFAYMLSDLGYDVWIGNFRGNRYSRKHRYLSTEKKEFWDFSFHEIGTYDIPAMIDYVLEKTKYKKLHYIGHSQGTSVFFVMCSQRPGYCDKILSMQAMAPIAHLKYVKSPVIRILSRFVNQLEFLMKMMGTYEFLPNNDFIKLAGQAICNEEAITQEICYNAIFLVTGYNSEQLNKTMLPAIIGHIPAGSSTKQLIHYGQLVRSGRFRMYDYGLFQNLKKYGTYSPPSYDLKKVTAPIALHFSMNDWLADLRDVRKLQNILPNVIKEYLIPEPKFNHLDFLLAINSREMVQSEVVMVMKQVENKVKLNKD